MTKPTARAELLLSLTKRHGWKLGAELGLFEGRTSEYLLTNVPNLKMIGVDVWRPIECEGKDKERGLSPKSADAMRAARARTYEVRDRLGITRFCIVEETTVEAAKRFGPGILDFCFVDASHETHQVYDDVRAWFDLVRKGGMILGHDADWPSVQRALKALRNEYVPFAAVEYLDGNVWAVRV